MVPAGTMTLVVTENLAPSTHLLVSLEPLVNSKKRIHHSHSHNCKRQKHDHSRRKRRVSFAPSLTISILPKHHVETWYTVDDYMEFEQNVRNTIQILRDPSIPTPPESAHFTKRGLEKYESHEGHARKKRHEQLHIQAVLREQERQAARVQEETYYNPRAFRHVCRPYSQPSLQVALEQGKRDAQQIHDLEDMHTKE